jgi:hypothetical protein
LSSTRPQGPIRLRTRQICGCGASITSLSFRVDDIEAATVRLVANGVTALSDEMDYINRKLRLFEGPEGITLELAQWDGLNASSEQGTN